MAVLDRVNSSDDVKKLNIKDKLILCDEIRDFLIDNVSETGGHLASNLGIVELTVALHSVFDIPKDKFVWDVGHQTYVHKILTGRKDMFATLRKFNGMSGFPKTSESDADVFNTGHSSTSISSALGIARARNLNGDTYSVGAIFGDGALTGGMMYEAMNDSGGLKTPFILILNDNNMSISKNVGSLSRYLRALRIKPGYSRVKNNVDKFVINIPFVGNVIKNALLKIKQTIRKTLLPNTIFENLGFEYFGPVDGHDLEQLIDVLSLVKAKQKPVFVHINTVKGKGYKPAEKRPDLFHGVGKFDKDTGEIPESNKDYSSALGKSLLRIAEKNDKVVGITCAMPIGTGISDFRHKFPERFFDVGIAEQHGVTMASGLSISGYIPVIPVYSSFLQRAYDQILHDVCLQGLHIVFPVDRAGVVGSDGETHQGIYDISYLSSMPGMNILSPSSFEELDEMLDYAINVHNGPIAIRYPRGCKQIDTGISFEFGKAHVVSEGDVTVYVTGRMIETAYKIQQKLKNIKIVVIPTIKPLDEKTILENASNISCVIEDGIASGGLGSMIAELFAGNNIDSKLLRFGFPDEPVIHGDIEEIDRKYGLDPDFIADRIAELKG